MIMPELFSEFQFSPFQIDGAAQQHGFQQGFLSAEKVKGLQYYVTQLNTILHGNSLTNLPAENQESRSWYQTAAKQLQKQSLWNAILLPDCDSNAMSQRAKLLQRSLPSQGILALSSQDIHYIIQEIFSQLTRRLQQARRQLKRFYFKYLISKKNRRDYFL